MWFLEHESLFAGKRVWLRPGSQQLFGRTKTGDHDGLGAKTWHIDNKAVSRKHVMLKVLDPSPENGTNLHSRSQIEVTDLSCRQGTTIDEKNTLKSQKAEDGTITYKSLVLDGTEHIVRLAHGYAPLKIVWQPVVLTNASKETKEWRNRSTRLHALDIKTSNDFQFDRSTHVISQKRNLPKVLSGLIAGKHIVTIEFLDTILRVASSSVDQDENYVPSQLEEDFDLWWPKVQEYIPAAGAEPVPQPHGMLLPDPSRSELFTGLTFVFLNDSQFNSLKEPISTGGGKALLFDVRPGETTVEEFVDYVRSVAGNKKSAPSNNDRLNVITVRLPAFPENMEYWAAGFVNGVDHALNQRSVLQNEFLNVILTKDRLSLQRLPADAIESPSTAPKPSRKLSPEQYSTPMSQPRAHSLAPEEAAPSVEETLAIPTRKRIHRTKTTSRFTGFDDYEPPTKKKKVENALVQNRQDSEGPAMPHQDHGVIDTQLQMTRASFRRPESMEKEEKMDILFPTAAKFKRQREATRAPSAGVEPVFTRPCKSKTKGEEALERLQRAKAKVDKDINVREQTHLRMKKEENRRKTDEESLREALQGVDMADMKNLAPIEEMEIQPRAARSSTRRQTQEHGERWNPEWNGRKNFKRFRRRGLEQGVQARKVLVTLEPAPLKKGFGVADAFYLEVQGKKSEARDKQRREADGSSEPEMGFTRPKRATQTHPEVGHVENSKHDGEEVTQGRTQKSDTQRIAETQGFESQTQGRGRKREPGVAAPGERAGKRGKISIRDDDSDDEETGFRFRRRGGGERLA